MKSYPIYSFGSGCSCCILHLWESAVLVNEEGVCITHCCVEFHLQIHHNLSILLFIDIWGVNRLGAIMYKTVINTFQCNFWWTWHSFLLGRYTGKELLGHRVDIKDAANFQKWLYQLTLPPAISAYSSCSTLSLILYIISSPNFSHSGKYIVIYHCGFNLHI